MRPLYRNKSVRQRGGRAEARGANTKILASSMVDNIIGRMNDKLRKPTLPNKSELVRMLGQAKLACDSHPDSVAAKRRYNMLLRILACLEKQQDNNGE